MRRVKTVLHVHTHYSHDSDASPADIVAAARREGVDCVAITDHDDIRGALELARGGEIQVIVGQEVSSSGGHILGLFLSEPVAPALSPLKTAERIREQGGLVFAPHPFSLLCGDSLGEHVYEILPLLDGVEICNAQNPLPWDDSRAARFARRHRITPFVGADAHLRGQLAAAYQTLQPFAGAKSFLAALRTAELTFGHFGLSYFARSIWREAVTLATGRVPAHYGAFARKQQTQQQAAAAA